MINERTSLRSLLFALIIGCFAFRSSGLVAGGRAAGRAIVHPLPALPPSPPSAGESTSLVLPLSYVRLLSLYPSHAAPHVQGRGSSVCRVGVYVLLFLLVPCGEGNADVCLTFLLLSFSQTIQYEEEAMTLENALWRVGGGKI